MLREACSSKTISPLIYIPGTVTTAAGSGTVAITACTASFTTAVAGRTLGIALVTGAVATGAGIRSVTAACSAG